METGDRHLIAKTILRDFFAEMKRDFPDWTYDRPYYHAGVRKIFSSDEVYKWFVKYFGEQE